MLYFQLRKSRHRPRKGSHSRVRKLRSKLPLQLANLLLSHLSFEGRRSNAFLLCIHSAISHLLQHSFLSNTCLLRFSLLHCIVCRIPVRITLKSSSPYGRAKQPFQGLPRRFFVEILSQEFLASLHPCLPHPLLSLTSTLQHHKRHTSTIHVHCLLFYQLPTLTSGQHLSPFIAAQVRSVKVFPSNHHLYNSFHLYH